MWQMVSWDALERRIQIVAHTAELLSFPDRRPIYERDLEPFRQLWSTAHRNGKSDEGFQSGIIRT
jgi:hypothetical protein